MPTFSRASQLKLASCHADLQTVCRELIKQYDFTVLEGYRGEQAQNKAFAQGASRFCYPHSAHNKQPSLAVDIAPYPLDWDDIGRFREMLIRFDALAQLLRQQQKITSEFVYGAFWPHLKDYPHIEIKEK